MRQLKSENFERNGPGLTSYKWKALHSGAAGDSHSRQREDACERQLRLGSVKYGARASRGGVSILRVPCPTNVVRVCRAKVVRETAFVELGRFMKSFDAILGAQRNHKPACIAAVVKPPPFFARIGAWRTERTIAMDGSISNKNMRRKACYEHDLWKTG
jgi:hypothetical protein